MHAVLKWLGLSDLIVSSRVSSTKISIIDHPSISTGMDY